MNPEDRATRYATEERRIDGDRDKPNWPLAYAIWVIAAICLGLLTYWLGRGGW